MSSTKELESQNEIMGTPLGLQLSSQLKETYSNRVEPHLMEPKKCKKCNNNIIYILYIFY